VVVVEGGLFSPAAALVVVLSFHLLLPLVGQFLLIFVVVLLRVDHFPLKSAVLLLLVVQDAFEFENLVFEFPDCEFAVVAVGLDLCDFLLESSLDLP
jgi:hypothetical protein